MEYLPAIETFYATIDSHLAAVSPYCANCGQCCNFSQYGHRLYVTTLEMLYLWSALKNWKVDRIQLQTEKLQSGICPYQTGKNCALHAFRPSGCRIFYCKELNRQFQAEITEQALESLRSLHIQFGAVYYYADLLDWLSYSEQLTNNSSNP